jgi:CDP-diacylglycerol--serine O-phosphatidyltransferase
MQFKRFIPNLLTLLNLFSGTIATIFAVQNELVFAAYFVFLGIFFDFFDGLAARLLKVEGELGKQLDSLADVVTSGVVPGIVMFQLLLNSFRNEWEENLSCELGEWISYDEFSKKWFALIGLLITLGAAYRLAKFNIDTRQTSSFIGLPTPAASIVVLSFPLILAYSSNALAQQIIGNQWFLMAITVLLTYLMNAEIPLFALKFKDFSWKNNKIKFAFILLVIALAVVFQFMAIPIAILLYVLISLLTNKLKT